MQKKKITKCHILLKPIQITYKNNFPKWPRMLWVVYKRIKHQQTIRRIRQRLASVTFSFYMCSFNQDLTTQHLSYRSVCSVSYSIFANPFYLIIISIIHKTNTVHKTRNEYIGKPSYNGFAAFFFCQNLSKSLFDGSIKKYLKFLNDMKTKQKQERLHAFQWPPVAILG